MKSHEMVSLNAVATINMPGTKVHMGVWKFTSRNGMGIQDSRVLLRSFEGVQGHIDTPRVCKESTCSITFIHMY
jgi:hypothetical protein